MDSFETGFIKYVLFLFNLIFAISGIGLIITGSVVLSDIREFQYFMEGHIVATPIVLIVVGVIVCVVAFLGCFGAIRESVKLLIGFTVCMLIIFVAELSVGIAAAVFKHNFEDILNYTLKESMDRYYTSKADRVAWDNIQVNLECCGATGPNDWPEKQRPFSCCHKTERKDASPPQEFHCVQAAPGDDILWTDGCFEKLKLKAKTESQVLIGVAFGIAFVEVFGVILAIWMIHALKKRDAKK